MGMGFQFEQHWLRLWDLSWDLKKKKTICWEMGLGPPLHDPHKYYAATTTCVSENPKKCSSLIRLTIVTRHTFV